MGTPPPETREVTEPLRPLATRTQNFDPTIASTWGPQAPGLVGRPFVPESAIPVTGAPERRDVAEPPRPLAARTQNLDQTIEPPWGIRAPGLVGRPFAPEFGIPLTADSLYFGSTNPYGIPLADTGSGVLLRPGADAKGKPPDRAEAAAKPYSIFNDNPAAGGKAFEHETRNVVGARIGSDANGVVRGIERTDRSSIRAEGEGKDTKLTERAKDGKIIHSWHQKEGTDPNKPVWVSDQDPTKERTNFKLEKNGNMSWEAGGERHIVRGNGAELKENVTKPTYTFDEQGRFQWIAYPDGNNLFGFSYKGDSDKVTAVHTHDRSRNKTNSYVPDDTWGSPTLDRDGTYSQTINTQHDGKKTALKHSYRPDGTETHETIGANGAITTRDELGRPVSGRERQNMVRERNGNITFSENGEKHILLKNGGELIEGPGRASYNFDRQGRVSWINYPDGRNSFGFKYKGHSDEIEAVYTHDRQTKHTTTHKPDANWGNPRIAPDGTYSQEAYRYVEGQRRVGKQTFGTRGNDSTVWDGPVSSPPGEAPPSSPPRVAPKSSPTGEATRPPQPEPRRTPDGMEPRPDQPNPAPPADRPTGKTALNESTDHSFQLKAYLLPSPDQLGAGSCLYMAATGITEFMLAQSRGITNPQVGGPTDISEQGTINLSKQIGLRNPYTDAPMLLSQGGYLLDAQMPFRAYASSSWMNEGTVAMNGAQKPPGMRKHVLFDTGGEGTQNTYGRMTPEHLDRIKQFLRTNESPVLFVYKPPTANWWHANMITGYDDRTKTFTVRDSSFGNPVANAPSYTYGGRSPYGPKPYRGETQMSYTQALQWGNHATGYTLAADADARLATANR